MSFLNRTKMPVTQCTHQVSDDEEILLTAVLGSCIAVCAFDEKAKVGGMNHILLPGKFDGNLHDTAGMYGANLMELLLNDLMRRGARKRNLQCKLFGGAKVMDTEFDVGRQNIEFVSQYIQNENLNVLSSSVGGSCGRQLEFHPVSGKSRQKLLPDIKTREKPAAAPKISKDVGEMELF